ncbi:MAG TPA: AraC family transcriptional regulator [Hymenobacter sp.]|jgi:AraC-like DNA-binding protein
MYIQSVVDNEEKSLQGFVLFKQRKGRNTVINSRCKYCNWPTHTDQLSLKFSFSGTETYYLKHQKLAVHQDRLLVVNAGQPHASSVRSEEWVHSFAIYFDPQLVGNLAATCSASDEALLTNPHASSEQTVWFFEQMYTATPSLRRQLLALKREMELRPLSELELEERLHGILGQLLQTYRRQVNHSSAQLSAVKRSTRLEIYRRLHLAKDFIEDQANEALTLDAIAQASMLSKNHLLKHFRQLFSYSPYQYATTVRLEQAKTLLMQSALSVQEICAHVGFESPSSFGRLFKSSFVLTPHQYRLQHAG